MGERTPNKRTRRPTPALLLPVPLPCGQVHITLLDEEDNELATSARPAMLPHTSALLKGVGLFFSWPLHLLGLRQEVETVHVDCMDFYEVRNRIGLGSR